MDNFTSSRFTFKKKECSETREVLLDAGLIEEHATSLDSGGAAPLRESTSGSNARVSGLKLDDHMLGVKDHLEAAEDLLVEALLDLRASREILNDAVKLGKANHLAIGEVSDVGHATEEQEVMLAH